MPPPVPAPISDAQLVWRGDGTNVWNAGATANWRTNWFWNSNTAPALAFNAGNTVLFDISGSNNTAIRLEGSLTPGAVTVYAPKAFTFSGTGSLDGTMKLTKAGKGSLTLAGTNTFTGATLVAEGPFVVNGSLPSSPVTVRGGVWHDGRLAGSGVVGGSVRVEIAGGISPGQGANSPGTLTLTGGLTLAGGAYACFDLSNDPTGVTRTNDLLQLTGNLALSGTNRFVFTMLNTNLSPGVYPLIAYSGAFSGTLSNQVIEGLDGMPVVLTNPPGQIALHVKAARPPTTLTWSGGFNGNAWDLLTSSNWLNGGVRTQFHPQDVVRFDGTGGANLTVTLSGSLNSGGVIVDSATNYTLGGGGLLMGTGGIAKSNTGTLTISGKTHTFTGRTVIAGGTLSIASLGIGGEPSSIGAAGTNAANLVMAGGTLQLIGDDAYTDRAMTLSSGANTFDIPSSGVQMTLVNSLSGAGRLVKTGSGLLVLTVANSYSGGTTIKAGRILLGGATANSSGLGGGAVTLEGGTLSMSDVQASETAAWNLVVPTNATARLDVDGRSTLSGSLTGGGTLTVFTPYVRTDFSGNWSAFTNQINIITDSDGGDFRCNNSAGYPNAKLNIGALASLQNRVGGTPTIPAGEISGAAGSTISAPGGNSGIGVNWRVGGLNTSATFAGNTWNNVGFVKVGTGTWTWTGTNNHTSGTTVSNGTLLVMGNATPATGTFFVASGGTLGGVGTLGGATTINGTLSPGNNAIGTLTFTNNLTLASGGSTVVEINKSTGAEDLIVVNGTLVHGGTLRVTNLAGTLATGDRFSILSAGSRSGTFASLNLPALGDGYAWDTSALYTSGTLSVIATNPGGPENLFWRGGGAASLWDIATTGNWVNTSNAVRVFDNGDTVTFDDTGSNNVPVNLVSDVQPAAFTVAAAKAFTLAGSGMMTGSNGIVKSGSGTFSLANANTCSGPVVINAGTLKLPGLAHRWSFNGSLSDSVGGQSARIVETGTNNATLTATNITLAGGTRATSDYVSLGSNALSPVDSPVTVELWARQNAVQNWARIFDFGASATENLFMSWSLGTLINTNRVEWKDAFTSTSNNVGLPYTLGVEHHIALVIEPRAGNNGTTRVSWYRAAASNALLGAAVGSFDVSNTLSGFIQTNCWLGRSAYSSDSTASASYNEVRIWNRALSAADLQTLHTAGPDTTFASLALATGCALPANAAVTLAGSGAILDNVNGQVQTLGSLSGVAGSQLKLTAGGVAAGRDNSSTTFAGTISGTGGFTKQGTGSMVLEGMNLFTGPLTVSAGSLFVNGVGASATGAVNVASGATLGGTGTLGGITIVAGTLAPGQNGIGRLVFSRAITMTGGSTNRFEIDKASMTNDSISASSILFGGALSVVNLGGALEAGDNYELFGAASRSGSFSTMTLPTLEPGLDWNTTRLVSEGRIWVVATTSPVFGGSSIVDGQIRMSGVGGTPGWLYYVLTATNAATPLAQWTPVVTNLFDAGGVFSFTNAIGLNGQQFYRIQVP